MRLPYDVILFDLECCQPSNKIFEIGAVKVLRNFDIVEPHFQSFVNPGDVVTQEIRTLCSLSKEDLEQIYAAPKLPEANQRFYEWATQGSKNVILASWGAFDTNALHSEDPKCSFRRKSLDIKSIAAWELARYGIKATNSLAASCEAFGVEIELPRHRALPDAITTARLLQALCDRHARFKDMLDHAAKSLA